MSRGLAQCLCLINVDVWLCCCCTYLPHMLHASTAAWRCCVACRVVYFRFLSQSTSQLHFILVRFILIYATHTQYIHTHIYVCVCVYLYMLLISRASKLPAPLLPLPRTLRLHFENVISESGCWRSLLDSAGGTGARGGGGYCPVDVLQI